MLHASTAFLTSGASLMRPMNSLLISSKRLESSGSCWRISCDPTKTDSSMFHFFATTVHVRRHDSTVPSFICHSPTVSAISGFAITNLFPDSDCNAMLCSSSVDATSSGTTRFRG